jgi:hypothetical protein
LSSNVFELVLELLAIDPIRRSAIGALLRTGGGREWQRRVGYQTFVKASGNTRLLRTPAIQSGTRKWRPFVRERRTSQSDLS